MRIIAIVLTAAVALVSGMNAGPSVLSQRGSELRLDPRIPSADDSLFNAVRDSRDWRNPHLLVSDKGLELRSLSSPEPRMVPLSGLQQTLVKLPVTDWPYGRIVAVQSPSIGSSDAVSIEASKQNVEAARGALKALGVREWSWPA